MMQDWYNVVPSTYLLRQELVRRIWLGVEKRQGPEHGPLRSALADFWFPWTLMKIITLPVHLVGSSVYIRIEVPSIEYADPVTITGLR